MILEDIKFALSDRRIKYATDYAVINKYGCTFVLCTDVFQEAIAEVFEKFGQKVSGYYLITGAVWNEAMKQHETPSPPA